MALFQNSLCFGGALPMRLCTLLWLPRGNAFFLVYFGRDKASFQIRDFAASLTVDLFLLIAGIVLPFYPSTEVQKGGIQGGQFSAFLKCIATDKNTLIISALICSSSYPII